MYSTACSTLFPAKPSGEHKPVQAVIAREDHTFELDEKALSKVLLHPKIKDKPVVVVSVAGAFRKGKSFLLDFFLRYMRTKYSTVEVDEETHWLGAPDEPLTGFSWKGGSSRITTGILVWSEAFVAKLPNDRKVAVVLMDTQGTFDDKSTVKDCTTLFALSMMLSSVQVYNLSQNIQEDDLMNLQLFTEYGRVALKESREKPFQKLLFLVRDWDYPYEHVYGETGGNELLGERLAINAGQGQEHEDIRKHIKECFEDISCFLMPEPGVKVRKDPKFDGCRKDIDLEFIQYIDLLVQSILAPENLVVKKVCGREIPSEELFSFFKSYMKIFTSGVLPEPKTVLAATAEVNNLAAKDAAKVKYNEAMERVCSPMARCLGIGEFEAAHTRASDEAVDVFDNRPKMGSTEQIRHCQQRLLQDIGNSYIIFKGRNEDKSIVFNISSAIANICVLASVGNVDRDLLYMQCRKVVCDDVLMPCKRGWDEFVDVFNDVFESRFT